MIIKYSEIPQYKHYLAGWDYVGVALRVRFDLPDRFTPLTWGCYGFQADARCMPAYCNKCRKTLPDFYTHLGSKQGYVGDIHCDNCGGPLHVFDTDSDVVDNIRYNGVEFDFNELYKFHWKYVGQIEKRTGINLKEIFPERKNYFLKDAVSILQSIIGVNTTGKFRYITDERIEMLPCEVNNWLEFLDICGVKGIYLSKYPDESCVNAG